MDTKREFIKFLEDLTQYIDTEIWNLYPPSWGCLVGGLEELQEMIDSKREELEDDE